MISEYMDIDDIFLTAVIAFDEDGTLGQITMAGIRNQLDDNVLNLSQEG